MESTLSYIDSKYNGMRNYLKLCGISVCHQRRLRAILLEKLVQKHQPFLSESTGHGLIVDPTGNSGTTMFSLVNFLDVRMVGYCLKLGGIRKNWKKRFFVLDNQRLHYFENHWNVGKAPVRSILLTSCHLAQPREDCSRLNLFELVQRNEKRSFLIQPERDRDEWIAALMKVISEISEKS